MQNDELRFILKSMLFLLALSVFARKLVRRLPTAHPEKDIRTIRLGSMLLFTALLITVVVEMIQRHTALAGR
jgi:hypothetical protein